MDCWDEGSIERDHCDWSDWLEEVELKEWEYLWEWFSGIWFWGASVDRGGKMERPGESQTLKSRLIAFLG